MQAKFLALLLLIFNIHASAQGATGILPILGPVVKIPSETLALRPRVRLSCALSIALGADYTTQWSGPGDAGIINPNTTADQYAITEDPLPLMDGSEVPGTTLTIRKLSYQDAGVYICSVRSLAVSNEEAPSLVSAEIDLQLEIDLSSKFNETVVMATTSDSTVKLSCEMSAFLRPDSSLIWEGPDNQILTSGMGKYQITYSNGSTDTAVDGSGILVPSRVSTLTIFNPDKSDQGVYTCSVIGTNRTIDLVIMINDAKTSPTATETDASTQASTVAIARDKTTNPESIIGTTKSAMVTEKVRSGSKSYYVNGAAALYVIVTSTIGVLLQHFLMSL